MPKMESASKFIPSLPPKKIKPESTLYVLILSRDWDRASDYVLRYPKEAGKRDDIEIPGGQGKTNLVLPIHVALANGAPLYFLQNLLHAHPKGISDAESATRRLPLHIAALEDTPVETFQFLLMAYVEAVRRADIYGSTPMHHAVYRANKPVIGRMLFQDRECATVTDKEGNTPLHLASQYWDDAGAAYHLARECPEALYIKNKAGMMPAEMARRFGHDESRNALASLMNDGERMGGEDKYYANNDLSRSPRGSIIRNGMKRMSSIARIGQKDN
jgi:hypothetical protein